MTYSFEFSTEAYGQWYWWHASPIWSPLIILYSPRPIVIQLFSSRWYERKINEIVFARVTTQNTGFALNSANIMSTTINKSHPRSYMHSMQYDCFSSLPPVSPSLNICCFYCSMHLSIVQNCTWWFQNCTIIWTEAEWKIFTQFDFNDIISVWKLH